MTHLLHFVFPAAGFKWDPAKTDWTAVRWMLVPQIVLQLLVAMFNSRFTHWSAAGWGSAVLIAGIIVFRPGEATTFVIFAGLLVLLVLSFVMPGSKSQ